MIYSTATTLSHNLFPTSTYSQLSTSTNAYLPISLNLIYYQGKPLAWDNNTAVDNYIARVRDTAADLTSKNRGLRAAHTQLAGIVATLAATDLVRKKEIWVRGVRDMRSIVSRVEADFGGAEQQGWRVHWDWQLYKALDV